MIDQHRTVPAVPVQRDQSVLADALPAGQFGEVLVQRQTRARGPATWWLSGTQLSTNQAKMSPTPDWPASYPQLPADDSAVDDAAHTWRIAQHDPNSSRDRSTFP